MRRHRRGGLLAQTSSGTPGARRPRSSPSARTWPSLRPPWEAWGAPCAGASCSGEVRAGDASSLSGCQPKFEMLQLGSPIGACHRKPGHDFGRPPWLVAGGRTVGRRKAPANGAWHAFWRGAAWAGGRARGAPGGRWSPRAICLLPSTALVAIAFVLVAIAQCPPLVRESLKALCPWGLQTCRGCCISCGIHPAACPPCGGPRGGRTMWQWRDTRLERAWQRKWAADNAGLDAATSLQTLLFPSLIARTVRRRRRRRLR